MGYLLALGAWKRSGFARVDNGWILLVRSCELLTQSVAKCSLPVRKSGGWHPE